MALERVDQPGERQLLRVAEREVGDARVEVVALPVAARRTSRTRGATLATMRSIRGSAMVTGRPSRRSRTYSSRTLPFGNVRVPVSRKVERLVERGEQRLALAEGHRRDEETVVVDQAGRVRSARNSAPVPSPMSGPSPAFIVRTASTASPSIEVGVLAERWASPRETTCFGVRCQKRRELALDIGHVGVVDVDIVPVRHDVVHPAAHDDVAGVVA